jgi:hypothetical protein
MMALRSKPAAATNGFPSGPSPATRGRTFILAGHLVDRDSRSASDVGLLSDWQRIVDALVVAGVSQLAPYSE